MKKILVLLLAIALISGSLLALASCNKGDDEETVIPSVGENGNWWIGDTDTGIPSKGPQGDVGDVGAPGADGSNGTDAQPPKFRYNTETKKLEVSYDNGETWLFMGTYSYPIEDIVKLPGTIADKDNKNKKADGYYGALIDISKLDYSYVQLERNKNGNELGYAFLKSELTLDATPTYATGYTHCVWDTSKKVTLEIPEDAKYLYVYHSSKGNIFTPDSVTFLEAYIDPLKTETANEYVYPIDEIEVLDGYVTSSNFYSKSSTKKGAIIELAGTTFNTVTMKKNASGEDIIYAFMSDELCYDHAPCYAAGYTNVVSVTDDSITVRIPDNARYLYVYNNNSKKMHLPSEIKFTKESYEPEDSDSVRIATWNIGHFALGRKPNSTLEDAQSAMQGDYFRDYINNAIDADIMFLNEYSQKFTKNKYLAKNTIFTEYDTVYEGAQRNYSCNAVYSKIEISEPEVHEFECNKTAGVISTKGPLATDYYFVTTDVVINGTTVKLVSVHLAFDGEGSKNVVINQLNELIAYCEQYEHVVLLGDWNINSFSEFELFTDAGYTLANTDNKMPTYKKDDYSDSLDNIIYKGVTVSDFSLAGTDLSDHYALYCTITVNKD